MTACPGPWPNGESGESFGVLPKRKRRENAKMDNGVRWAPFRADFASTLNIIWLSRPKKK